MHGRACRLHICSMALPIFLLATAGHAQEANLPAPTDLARMSDELEDITASTMRCVVRITSDTYVADDSYQRQSDQAGSDIANANPSEGSGVLVSSDGYIVTNAHVVSGAQRLRVTFYPAGGLGRQKSAKIVGIDAASDLAVLRIQADNLPYLNLDDSATARQGEISLAFGDPLGMERSVTMGVVSAVRRQLEPTDPRLWIQTDAAVNPGNSGGPLVDARGHLLGINTQIYSASGGNEGIAFAIPANTVREVFQDLVAYGKVQRVSLGLSPLAIAPGIATALQLDRRSGVLVEDVEVGSPAASAGVKPGDVLVDINGHHVHNVVEFTDLMKTLKPGVAVEVHLLRGGQPKTLRVAPVEADPSPIPLEARVSPGANLVQRLEILGVTLDSDVERLVGPTRYEHGVVVATRSSTLRVGRDSLEPRDIIYQVNGKDVTDVQSLRALLAEVPGGRPLVLQIERDNSLYYVPLEGARQ
jgi:serine protease Do